MDTLNTRISHMQISDSDVDRQYGRPTSVYRTEKQVIYINVRITASFLKTNIKLMQQLEEIAFGEGCRGLREIFRTY